MIRSILLIALLIFLSYMFGFALALWNIGRLVIVPLCTILFGSVNGKAAEDFCNQCCETERGEKIARLFYIFYRAGYRCTNSPELSQTFDRAIDRQDSVEQILKAVSNELVNK